MSRTFVAALAALTSTMALPAAAADAVETFFNGREIRLVVGTGSGGGYDAYARLVARFMGKYVPGTPTIVVQNMPGASGIKAVNFLYSVAPKDGTALATFNNSMPVYQAIGQTGVQFKTESLSWVGAMSKFVNVVAVWHTTGVKTIEDAKRIEVVIGATGGGGTIAGYPTLLNSTLGTKFKVVTGYEGGNAINLALERGEVQGRGNLSWSSIQTGHPDWYRDRKIVPIVQIGSQKEPDLQDVPLLTELAGNDEQRQMFEFVSAVNAMERPFAGPPALPKDRLEALRRAFDRTAKDADFLAAAAKQDLPIDASPGEDIEKIVARIVATPPAIVEKTKQAMGGKGLD
ncbi:MAG: Bug family tripartite tricarboxylate transporter substrate binding protein [Gemmatimonas sp.]